MIEINAIQSQVLSLYLISWFCYALNQTLTLRVICEIFNLVMNKVSKLFSILNEFYNRLS